MDPNKKINTALYTMNNNKAMEDAARKYQDCTDTTVHVEADTTSSHCIGSDCHIQIQRCASLPDYLHMEHNQRLERYFEDCDI